MQYGDVIAALEKAESMSRDSGKPYCIIDSGDLKVTVTTVRLAKRHNAKILEVARHQSGSIARYMPLKFK